MASVICCHLLIICKLNTPVVKRLPYILDCRTFESALKDGSDASKVSVFTERTDPSSAEQYFQVIWWFSCIVSLICISVTDDCFVLVSFWLLVLRAVLL